MDKPSNSVRTDTVPMASMMDTDELEAVPDPRKEDL
jgi:hypothetical protein